MIKQLVIENFLSFQKRQEINLQPLTVVIGANNSGKSNLISAFRAFQDRSQEASHYSAFCNRRVNSDFTLSIANSNIDMVTLKSTIGKNWNGIDHSRNNGISQLIQGFRFFKFSVEILKQKSQISPNPILGSDGNGLAAVLDFLHGEHPDVYEKIEDDFKRFVPEVERIQLRTIEHGQKVVLLKQRGFKEPFPANEISDGLLLFLALLCCVNTQPAPSLICLDEPDNGIHPRRLRALLDQLRSLTERKENPVQILMTTHSPYMLDWFKDDLESVLILDRTDEDGTIVRTAKDVVGPRGLMGSTLGDLWYSGMIGGVPV